MGVAYEALGNYPQVIDCYQQHLVLAREIGDRRGEANALEIWAMLAVLWRIFLVLLITSSSVWRSPGKVATRAKPWKH